MEKLKTDVQFGDRTCSFLMPESTDILSIKEPPSMDENQLADILKTQLPSVLPQTLSGYSRIAIVVADKTRLCQYDLFLPVLLELLLKSNIEPENITFFIAYGTHARQSDDQSNKAYGKIFQQYRFVHHDCRDKALFKKLGTTRRGTNVHARTDLLSSDLIITFGALSHHYFAGYGGGRKLLFPGLAFKDDIYQNHSLFLDFENGELAQDCRPGNLKGNPLADDLKEIDEFLEIPRINIHGILNSAGKVCRLEIGQTFDEFEAACSILDRYYKVSDHKEYNTVVASCGGFPKDINFIQAHKAINNAAGFVKDGGNLIMLAQCIDGIGSDTFLPYFQLNDMDAAFGLLEKHYQGNGGTALSMMMKTRRINIFIKTNLDDKICSTIGVHRIDSHMAQTLIDKNENDLALIQNASLLIS